MEPTRALQKSCTINPGTIRLAKSNISALIINVNNPKVKTVIGNAKSERMGLINVLTSPMTRAATREVVKSATSIPVTIFETIYKDNPFTNHRISTFIEISVSYFHLLRHARIDCSFSFSFFPEYFQCFRYGFGFHKLFP